MVLFVRVNPPLTDTFGKRTLSNVPDHTCIFNLPQAETSLRSTSFLVPRVSAFKRFDCVQYLAQQVSFPRVLNIKSNSGEKNQLLLLIYRFSNGVTDVTSSLVNSTIWAPGTNKQQLPECVERALVSIGYRSILWGFGVKPCLPSFP